MSETIQRVLEGILPPEREWKYSYAPFDVPDGVERIDVAYRYDAAIGSDPHLSGGNTIDIGIFDARGIGFHSPGFRGWSGSARAAFFIAQEEATPGYMPGAILPGTWNVVLGPYKVAAEGCHYRIEITLTFGKAASVEFPALLGLSDAPSAQVNADGWYKGDIHCHTIHSDGDSTPETLVRLAEALGFDFLAITDHNNRTQGIDLAKMETRLDRFSRRERRKPGEFHSGSQCARLAGLVQSPASVWA
ncbi:MAG: PHP domain-containing protein [Chloroflexota bacterium]